MEMASGKVEVGTERGGCFGRVASIVGGIL